MKYVIVDRQGRFYTRAGCPTYWSSDERNAEVYSDREEAETAARTAAEGPLSPINPGAFVVEHTEA